MVWYDIVVLAILAYCAWQGAQRGLVTQLAWIAALILCFKFADQLAPAIEPQINVEQPLRHWIAMFILYLGFSVGAFMLARILNSWLEQAKFKDFDRHLGGIFGLVKGGIIVMVITFFAVTLSESLKATVLQSGTGRVACRVLDGIEPLTPQYFPEYWHDYLDRYQKELEPLHNEHIELGDGSSSLPGWMGGDESSGGESSGGGSDGFNLPGFIDGLAGAVGSGRPDDATDTGGGTTLDELWRTLPQQMRQQFGDQIQKQWNSATPEQKQNFVNNLGRSFDREIPGVVSEFLSSIGSSTGQAGSVAGGSDVSGMLASIGRIYESAGYDSGYILQQTREHLVGLPEKVQAGVIRDWYADMSLQPNDPDNYTDVKTHIDVRILRQIDKAGVRLSDLSYELRQRLDRSRQ
ncbi:CvpA family protein [Fuerstiella marisgermanici]|uniref:Colicin V production protein n=1 Tax=Fuerstiella marisgermanici TaxID=1891926 RepID=A0A1P8WNW2_9PLAN|nr:CvpA family protein [Fuerstiella marisgermanici]APZ95741.1 colicin V production protein [Fuerstiella marisgermanici]